MTCLSLTTALVHSRLDNEMPLFYTISSLSDTLSTIINLNKTLLSLHIFLLVSSPNKQSSRIYRSEYLKIFRSSSSSVFLIGFPEYQRGQYRNIILNEQQEDR